MASLRRRTYKTIDKATGRVVKRKTRKWYGKFRDENGVEQRVPLSPNKTVAQQMLNRLLEKVERKKAGLHHPAEDHGRRPLTEHLADYENELRARGIAAGQVRQTAGRVRAVLDGCAFTFALDIQAAPVLEFLAGLRRERPRLAIPAQEWFTPVEIGELLGVQRPAVTALLRRHGLRSTAQGRGRARRFPRTTVENLVELASRGLGSQTVSYYWREFKTFCRWMCSPRQKRMLDNPLADITGPDPRADPRHDRRPLSAEELRRVLESAKASTWTWRELTGTDRFHLYLTACVTGYRRGELGALTPSSFDLEADPPVIALPGRRTKNKRVAVQPLPSDVADVLRTYLHGRDPQAPIWGKKRLKEIVVALRHDLEAVGIPYVVEGPEGPLFFDFHGLRHSYVLLLDQSGASLKEAMQLARHSDPKLTMARYGRVQLHDLGAAVERLPSLVDGTVGSGAATTAPKATGTEGNYLPQMSALAPPLAPTADNGCERPITADHAGLCGGVAVTAFASSELRLVDNDCEQVIILGEIGANERAPGDRRRAFLYGEELVPGRKSL